MAGKAPQGGATPAKRPAISIEANFDEPTRAQASRAAAAADKTSALPTTRSNIIIWSIVIIVLGAPVIAVIWLIAMPESNVDRYPAAQVTEAKAEMRRIGTKAQIAFDADPSKIPAGPTLETFGMSEKDLGGEYSITYEMMYADGVLTIFARNLFSDLPADLIMLANLRTGDMQFNRE